MDPFAQLGRRRDIEPAQSFDCEHLLCKCLREFW